ncbi:MAG: hypothetical protein JEZ07_08555 [Phycisphaerae bacterium]|nr:hypothetical protein [Phycisphaerae bacterium]
MRTTLRKTSAWIPVTYGNTYSNNLTGQQFTADIDNNNHSCTLSIDLSINLNKRNQNQNCVNDANELAENHEQLKSLHIHDQQVTKGIRKLDKNNTINDWILEIILGSKGPYSYSASLDIENDITKITIK